MKNASKKKTSPVRPAAKARKLKLVGARRPAPHVGLPPQLVVFAASLIFLLSLTLRTVHLQDRPPGFFCDEADIINAAYSIATTGHDEANFRFPVMFHGRGNLLRPVQIYSAVPFVWLLGMHETTIRLVSVCYAMATLALIFVYLRAVAGVELALLSGLLLAVSPWHIHLSRMGMENCASVFWMTLTVFALDHTLRGARWFAVAVFAGVVAFFTYAGSTLPVVIVVLAFVARHWRAFYNLLKKDGRAFYTLAAGGLVTFWLLFDGLFSGEFLSRWNQTNQGVGVLPLLQGYFNHFSIGFLFRLGDIDFPGAATSRHSVRGIGELYWMQLPFLILGFAAALWDRKLRRRFEPVLFLLAVYPLGSAVLTTNPVATRSASGVVPLTILSALGVLITGQWLRRRWRSAAIGFAVLFSLATAGSLYHYLGLAESYPTYASDYYGWQHGFREGVQALQRRRGDREHMYITHAYNGPDALLWFYRYNGTCPKCELMNNPPHVREGEVDLYATRPVDVEGLENVNPGFKFHSEEAVVGPSGKDELWIGTFRREPAARK